MAASENGSSLSFDELVQIFGYLPPEGLSKCSQVCKDWYEASQVGSLWRRHCLQRWNFCNLKKLSPGERTWQKYFIARHKIDTGVVTGRPGQDYICKTLRGHKNQVTDVVFVTSNNIYDEEIIEKNACPIAASCGQDKSVCLWNLREGKNIWTKQSHESSVSCLSLVTNDALVASGDQEGEVKLWDISTGEDTHLLGSHSAVVTVMFCGKDVIGSKKSESQTPLLFVGYRDGYVKMWDIRTTAKPQFELTSPFGVNNMRLRSDYLLATSSKFESPIKLFDIRYLAPDYFRRPEIKTLCHPFDALVSCFSWVPGKQNLFVAGYSNGDILLWSGDTCEQLHCFSGHRGEVSCIDVLGSSVVSGGKDCTLRLWDLDKLEALQSHSDHQGPVTSLYADAYRVMTCSRDFSIRTYCWSRNEPTSPSHSSESARTLESKYTLLGGSLQRAGNGFEKVICDYSTCVAMANDVLKAYSFQV